jgi:hypothetical protein
MPEHGEIERPRWGRARALWDLWAAEVAAHEATRERLHLLEEQIPAMSRAIAKLREEKIGRNVDATA